MRTLDVLSAIWERRIRDSEKELPDFGKVIATPDGKGKVVGLNLLSRIVSIRLTGRENPVEYEWDELKEFIQVGEMNG